MIVRLKGKCIAKKSDRIHLESGFITYEIFVFLSVLNRIETDRDVDLIIYHYIQNDQNKGHPVFIGFLNELEEEFFTKFITVSGIGPKAALRAIDRSIAEIAMAIDTSDLNYLKTLPGIGLQRAKNIIASLQGKMGRFILINDKVEPRTYDLDVQRKGISQEALAILEGLQYRKKEAEQMIIRALNANNQISTTEDLLNEIYKRKANGT